MPRARQAQYGYAWRAARDQSLDPLGHERSSLQSALYDMATRHRRDEPHVSGTNRPRCGMRNQSAAVLQTAAARATAATRAQRSVPNVGALQNPGAPRA